MARTYPDWFSVDVAKRAAMARGRPLGQVLKELLANSLDAGATRADIACQATPSRRRDRAGFRAYTVICSDNGRGCHDPEILRTIGASTNDLHPETRGRFGQGLIDVVAACEKAEIRTLNNRLVFDDSGCAISTIRTTATGMAFTAVLRHPGEGFDELYDYFCSIIVPEGVNFTFNGALIPHRRAIRRVEAVKLQTIVYDPEKGRDKKFLRPVAIELVPQLGESPMIYELGIPVDTVPWSLSYDINVLQKTPLDTERNMLPDRYNDSLVRMLIQHVSDLYEKFMDERDNVPREIKNCGENAAQLHERAQEKVVEKMVRAKRRDVARENPFDPDNDSEAEELRQRHGKRPVNTGSLPDGVRRLLKDNPTVAELHDQLCKPHFGVGCLPPETTRQRQCLQMYSELASAMLDVPVSCNRLMGGSISAAWRDGTISLNINVAHIWAEPLGEESIGLILHECAHCKVSGHSIGFQDEIARLGGKLAGWIGSNPQWWTKWQLQLNGPQELAELRKS